MSNYHWYLKQSLAYPPNQNLLQPRWDPEDAGLFSLVVGAGHHNNGDAVGSEDVFETIRLSWAVAASRGQSEADAALVAVIDGHSLKMTPFREAVIPPPMAAYEIHVGRQVEAVLFPPSEKNDATVASSDSGLVGRAARDPNSLVVVATHQSGGQLFVFTTDNSDGNKEALARTIGGGGDGMETNGVEVKLTGAGGTGYTVQTTRHSLLGSLELAMMTSPVTSRLTNWVWSGSEELMASTVAASGPAVLVFQVCVLQYWYINIVV